VGNYTRNKGLGLSHKLGQYYFSYILSLIPKGPFDIPKNKTSSERAKKAHKQRNCCLFFNNDRIYRWNERVIFVIVFNPLLVFTVHKIWLHIPNFTHACTSVLPVQRSCILHLERNL